MVDAFMQFIHIKDSKNFSGDMVICSVTIRRAPIFPFTLDRQEPHDSIVVRYESLVARSLPGLGREGGL